MNDIKNNGLDTNRTEDGGRESVIQQNFHEERALFHRNNLTVSGCVFDTGESPLKECSDIDIDTSIFKFRYPLWYCNRITLKNSRLCEASRAGVWYTDNISIEDTVIEAPKCLRRVHGASLTNVSFSAGDETLWHSDGIKLDNVYVKGDYFALNTNNMEISKLTLTGKYSFDGDKNLIIRDSNIFSRDAFWNTENVTVENSFISGEYLGWNSKNLTLTDCTIESLQGMCYVDNLVMKNCRLINTALAFEYADCEADIRGKIDSVLNPSSGVIRAERIGTLIIQRDIIHPEKTRIICDDIEDTTCEIDWSVITE